MRMPPRFILLLALALALAPLPRVHAADALTLAVLANRPVDVLQSQYRPLADYLSQSLDGREVRLQLLSHEDIDTAVERQGIDFILTSPALFVELRQHNVLFVALATRVLLHNGVAVSASGGVIVRRKDRRGINTLADLRGRVVAVGGTHGLSGDTEQLAELAASGLGTGDVHWRQVGQPQDRVVQSVLDGEADAGFVDAGVLEAMTREGRLDAAQLVVLNRQELPGYPFAVSTRLYPEWPFIALPSVDADVARRVSAALLLLEPGHPAARAADIKGFVTPASYAPVERLMRDLRIHPFDQVPAFTLLDVGARYPVVTAVTLLLIAFIVALVVVLVLGNRRQRRSHAVELAQARQLELEQQHLWTLVRLIPDAVWLKDENGAYLACNERFEQLYGAAAADILGKTDRDFVDAEQAELFRRHDLRALEKGRPSTNLEWLTFADGHRELAETTKTPMFDRSGALVGILGIAHDITRQQADREALEASQERLNALVQQAADGIVLIDCTSMKLVEFNNAACEMLGYTRAEFGQLELTQIMPALDSRQMRRVIDRVIATGSSDDETRYRHRDGSERDVRVTGRLANSGGEVYIVAIWTDITRQKANEAQLRDYREHLEELVANRTAELLTAKNAAESASLAKSTFLANMSHELRTPMNAIIGLTYILGRSEVDVGQRDKLDKISHSAKHLLQLLNDILDLSKIDADAMRMEDVPLTLGDVLLRVYSVLGQRAAAKHLQFPMDIAPQLRDYPFTGDPLRLQQVLLNLAGNAIKFTERGSVRIGASLVAEDEQSGVVRFRVSDTGVGIAADALERIFHPFEQADGSITRNFGGTGLGLPISRRLVGLMGGELAVSSIPGEGSLFEFSIRLGRGGQQTEAVAAGKASRGEFVERALRLKHGGKRVLVAEDDSVNQELLLELLNNALPCTVDLAQNGWEAVRLARANRYDLVLMDMQMPDMDGLDATRHIRAQSLSPGVPIIAITANAFVEDRQACLAAGMNDFVTKPVYPDILFSTLLEWFDRGPVC